MKRRIKFFIYLFFTIFAVGQSPSTDSHWELIWEDNFSGTQLDLTKWKAIDWSHGNASTLYLKDNVRVENGNLVLTVNNNHINCYNGHPPTIWGNPCEIGKTYQWNSGWIESLPIYNEKYGYFEANIKLPNVYGLWPAFWTFIGDGVQNANNAAEIDIFEIFPGKYPTNVTTTNIWFSYPNPPGFEYFKETALKNSFFNYSNWNKYAIEWSPYSITWYVNDYPIRKVINPGVVDYVKVILNLAVNFGEGNEPNYSSIFPSNMLVDYFKVYKLKNDCNTTISSCNYDFNLHDKRVKKEMIFGNGSCNNVVTNGQKVILKATDNVILNSNFNVDLGGELFIDVNPCY